MLHPDRAHDSRRKRGYRHSHPDPEDDYRREERRPVASAYARARKEEAADPREERADDYREAAPVIPDEPPAHLEKRNSARTSGMNAMPTPAAL